MKEIIIATKNKGKVNEFRALFHPFGIAVKSLLDFDNDIPDVAETGTTFTENARLKAETIATTVNTVVIADDSGLSVEVLKGDPGVYSARYAGEPKSDAKNNEKLLNKMQNEKNRAATFHCVLAFAVPEEATIFAQGNCKGKIAQGLSGQEGFGYDPLFIPDGYDVTMAELDSTEKNSISHRYHALQKLKRILINRGIIKEKDNNN